MMNKDWKVGKHFDRIDLLVARRIQDATEKYGVLNLETDKRDFFGESSDEKLDDIAYTWILKGQGKITEAEAAWLIRGIKHTYVYLQYIKGMKNGKRDIG